MRHQRRKSKVDRSVPDGPELPMATVSRLGRSPALGLERHPLGFIDEVGQIGNDPAGFAAEGRAERQFPLVTQLGSHKQRQRGESMLVELLHSQLLDVVQRDRVADRPHALDEAALIQQDHLLVPTQRVPRHPQTHQGKNPAANPANDLKRGIADVGALGQGEDERA